MGKRKDKEVRIFYGIWIAVAGFVLLFLFSGAGFYSFSIFIKPFEETFGWSRAAISLAMSIYMVLHGACGPLVGYLTEKYGPKRIMTFFAIGTGASFILVSFTQSLWFFYMTYALLSVTTTGIGFIPVSRLLTRWFVRRRGTAIGFTMVGIAAGGFVMSPVAGMLNTYFSWRISYVFLGLLVWALGIPMTLFVMKGSPSEMGLRPDGDAPDTDSDSIEIENGQTVLKVVEEGWPLKPALKTRTFWWVALTYLLAPMAQGGVLNHQVPLVTEAGLAPTAAAMAMGITAGMGGFGKLGFGRLSESLPFHYVAMACFGIQALAIFLLLAFQSPTVVWIYVVLFGFGMGGIVVLLPLAVSHFFGLAAFGTIMGTVAFIQGIGSSSGGLISGLIFDHMGNYRNALILFGCIYLLAIAAIIMAGKPRPYMPEP
ncbi:MAG: MFS transporter [Deltaproteobacteria bacterium]|nr:MFS transporter [Deltaproteobacteria bacterium]